MLSNDPESRRMMGVKAKAHIAEHFLWESKVKEVIKIYQEVVNI